MIGYRPIDDYNIGVGVIGTRAQWRGVSVEETASTVKVEVRQISIQGPGFDDTITYVVVALREPLGTRMVVNGLTGLTLLPMTP